jgi:hypothetical protein
MNLYLLTQNQVTGYDTYDSCVVCAVDETAARLMHPWGEKYKYIEKQGWVQEDRPDWDIGSPPTWASAPRFVHVHLLGTARPEQEPGVICASYNAGQNQ